MWNIVIKECINIHKYHWRETDYIILFMYIRVYPCMQKVLVCNFGLANHVTQIS